MTPATVTEIWQAIQPRVTVTPDGCWRYRGACSQSGWKCVFYPVLRLGPTVWRLNRLMLILCWGNVRHPQDFGEPVLDWLHRVNAAYRADEASHTCDHAWCIAPLHLEWQAHHINVRAQHERRKAVA